MSMYNDLDLCRVSEPRGCGPYRYLITDNSSPVKAFIHLFSTRAWLKNLRLTPKLVQRSGQHAYFRLKGLPVKFNMVWDTRKFLHLKADIEFIDVSNGSYTLFKVLYLKDETKVVSLNPNVEDRPIFTYSDFRNLK